jgi:hypothetical protein
MKEGMNEGKQNIRREEEGRLEEMKEKRMKGRKKGRKMQRT